MSVGGSGKKKGTALPAINITPLVDVVLNIFMIVSPMITKTFWLNLPPKDDQKAEPAPTDNPLVMTVDKQGVVRMNTIVLAKNEISSRAYARGQRSEGPVLRRAQRGLVRRRDRGGGSEPGGRREVDRS